MKCPYCGNDAILIQSSDYYRSGVDYGWMLVCKPCDATVGCHAGTQTPKGTMANPGLRALRIKCHETFDPLWKSGNMSRKEAYAFLRQKLGCSNITGHIGMFREVDCERLLVAIAERESGGMK
jgi:zinc-finger-containing domain